MNLVRIFLISAFASFASQASSETLSGTASVIDGDTIEIHGQRIRLSAIDAIESRQPCQNPDGTLWRCGKDAAFAFSDMIGRRPVSCDVIDIDRYGRAVSICQVGGEDIGAWMVENGWALAYRRYGTDYVAAEDRARNAGRGIWTAEFMMPWDWRKAQN